MDDLIRWQLEKIEAHCRLLMEHAADPTCNCEVDLTSCLRKHSLLISTYASETLPMVKDDDRLIDLLDELSVEAREMKEKIAKATCDGGNEDLALAEVAHFGREWAKRIESNYTCPIATTATAGDNALEFSAVLFQAYRWLAGQLEPCNLSEEETRLALSWRPLRDFLAWAIGLDKPVKLCSVAMPTGEGQLAGLYQLFITDIGMQEKAIASQKAKAIPGMRQIFTPYNEVAFEVRVPAEEARELTWKPQEVIQPRGERGEQPSLFEKEPRWCFGVRKTDESLGGFARELGIIQHKAKKLRKQLEIPLDVCRGQAEMLEVANGVLDPYGSRCRNSETGQWMVSEECGFQPTGITTTAMGMDGLTQYEFEFKIVSLEDLIVSHDSFTFEKNADYPQELQPRLRERAATKAQVEKIAANLEPDALLTDFHSLDRGSPIIGDDMAVEAGNGRVMALRKAAADYPQRYDAYIDRLRERLRDFGLRNSDVDDVRQPVLVRLRITPVDRTAFTREANSAVTIAPSAIEKARTDAQKITVDMLQELEVGENESIESALRAPKNQGFARRFLNTLPENIQAALVDARGYLNRDGVHRMAMAIFVSAFQGDAGLRLAEKGFESVNMDVRTVFNAITRSIGVLARAENLIREGQREASLSISDDLAQTITVFAAIKRTPELTIEKYLAQSQMFEKELTDFQVEILKVLEEYKRSAKKLGIILTAYAEGVIELPPPAQTKLLPGPEIGKEELWERAVNALEREAEPEPVLVDRVAQMFRKPMYNKEEKARTEARQSDERQGLINQISARNKAVCIISPFKVIIEPLATGGFRLIIAHYSTTGERTSSAYHYDSVEDVADNFIRACRKCKEEKAKAEMKQDALEDNFKYAKHTPELPIVTQRSKFPSVKGILPSGLAGVEVTTKLVRSPVWEYGKAPVIKKPQDLQIFFSRMRGATREHLVAIFTDTRGHVIGAQEVAKGLKDASLVPVDAIIRTAILANATHIYLAHNHPAADPTPSQNDFVILERVEKAASLFGLEVPDMMIVGTTKDYSMSGMQSYKAPAEVSDIASNIGSGIITGIGLGLGFKGADWLVKSFQGRKFAQNNFEEGNKMENKDIIVYVWQTPSGMYRGEIWEGEELASATVKKTLEEVKVWAKEHDAVELRLTHFTDVVREVSEMEDKTIFQRQHYEAIAEVISTLDIAEGDRRSVAVAFARMFVRDNPDFDKARFLKAVGVFKDASLSRAKSDPKQITVFTNVIQKEYNPASSVHEGSIRVLKPDSDVLVYLGCPLSAKWDGEQCSENQTLIKTVVPKTEKYLQELKKFEVDSVPVIYKKEEGVEARSEEKELEEAVRRLGG